MKLIGPVSCLIALCAGGLGAQTRETESKTKIVVKDGQSVTVTGCVTPASGGEGFILTNVADKSGSMHDYMLVSDSTDLSKHIGHRVQISGVVTDRGNAKVKTESKVKESDDKTTRSRSEVRGDMGMPYLGVKSFKMIAASCP